MPIFINVGFNIIQLGSKWFATLGSLPSIKLRDTITKERMYYYEYQI